MEQIMNKAEFFLSIEPTAEEIAAAEFDLKNNKRAPVRGAPKSGAPLARLHKDFQARAWRLWMQESDPAQLARYDEAARLAEEGHKRWGSDDGKQDRVYLDGTSRYYDVNTGEIKR